MALSVSCTFVYNKGNGRIVDIICFFITEWRLPLFNSFNKSFKGAGGGPDMTHHGN